MSDFGIDIDTSRALHKVRGLRKGLTRTAMDRTVKKAAWVIHSRLLQQTPKRWTGQTRRGWTVTRKGASKYSVWNKSKVMLYLEKGTRAHGPKTAKRLFIPLNRKTALAGARKVFNSKGKFVFGRDYVLTKRVRGIRPRKIVANFRPFAAGILRAGMRLHVRKILSSI